MHLDPLYLDCTLLFITVMGLLTIPLAAAIFLGVVGLLLLNPTPLPPDFLVNYSLAMRLNSPAFLSIPLFALAGELAILSGIGDQLLLVADLLGGHGRRTVGPRAVIGCTLFASVSGVGATAVTAESRRLAPKMLRAGFTPEIAAASLACAAVLSIIIPSSVPITVYAATISVPQNVIATSCFFPGLLMAAALYLVITVQARRFISPSRRYFDPPARWFAVLWKAKWALLLPLIVLPGLFTGFFSAPEAAAFSCAYCLAAGRFINRGAFKSMEVWNALAGAATGSAAILFLAGVGGLFAMLLAGSGLSERLAESVYTFAGGKTGTILCMNIFLLVAGCFMDMPAIISLLVPPLLPLVDKCGIQPAHFGVIVIANIAVGLITPPQAWNIAAASDATGVAPGMTARAAVPFLIAMVVCLLVISFCPGLSLWFPELFGWPVG